MKRLSYKEVAKPGHENQFIKSVIECAGIPDFILQTTPELTFKMNDKTTGEKVEVYISGDDLKKYLENY